MWQQLLISIHDNFAGVEESPGGTVISCARERLDLGVGM